MLGRLALVLGSLLFGLILLELGCRLVAGPHALLHWPNLVLQQRVSSVAENTAIRYRYDAHLGWVQKETRSAHVNYDADGIRYTPPVPDMDTTAPPVLATGDSNTQGDEVNDDQTYPAWLQGLLKRRVVNAGVGAYGLDQALLRTEQMAPIVKPGLIVLGFVADDVRRSEMSRTWGAEKPYFALKDGQLELSNVPVPPSPDPRTTLDFWQTAFGWSLLLDTVLRHQGWQYEWAVDHVRAMPPGDGVKVSCLMMRRVKKLGIPTLVVAQYVFYTWENAEFGAEQHRVAQAVLGCAAEAGLPTLDLYEPFERAVRSRGLSAVYGAWHPSPEGYRLIAQEVANKLAALEK